MKYTTPSTHISKASLLFAVGMLSLNAVQAQQAPAEEVEEVVIVGQFQKSLETALDQKRKSASIIEAISAEDIGSLPDSAITDSLKRLPGLAQDRDRGMGSQISIRGMGGLLGLTTLNGREVATVEEDRNIRYDQFPSELINSAQVYKTPQAQLSEGGVSGTVNLDTIKPLSFTSKKVVIDVKGSYSDLGGDIADAASDGIGKRFSVSYVNQFYDNTVGLALGYAARSNPIATQRAELWNYGDTWHNTQWNDALGANVNAPWGGSALVRGGEDKRDGTMFAFQWKPNDNFELIYDAFYSRFQINESQRGFDFQISNAYANQWQLGTTAATKYTNSNLGAGAVDLLSGTVPLSSLRNLNEEFSQDDTLFSNGLNLKWTQDLWTISGDLSHSQTSRERMWSTIRTENTAPGYATFGAEDGRMTLNLLTANLTNPATNLVSGIEVKPDADGGDHLSTARFDFERQFEDSFFTSVKFGVQASSREKRLDAQNWEQSVTANAGVPVPTSAIIDKHSDSYWNNLPTYLTLDRNTIIKSYFGSLKNPNPGDANDLLSSWKVSEDITSGYVQLNMATEVAGLPLTGNIGVRDAKTKTESSGSQQGPDVWVEVTPGNWQPTQDIFPISVPHSYNDVLPSLNLSLNLTDDQIVRFAAAKTIARAPVDLMSPSLDLNQDLYGSNPGESTSGNPKLNPFRATQYDLTYEWYFNKNSSFALNTYYKDLNSYIARAADAETIVYNGTTYQVSRPINGSGGYIKGFEVFYQQAFDFLPAPFDGLGIYSNYAHNESDVKQKIPLYVEDRAGLTGLSKHTGNLTLWYYKSGFEVRTSYSYRSAFQRDVNRVQGEAGVNDAEGYVDLSLSYEINDNYKVYLQAQNLNNSPYKVYGLSSNNENHINKYEEFGRSYTVGVTWKL